VLHLYNPRINWYPFLRFSVHNLLIGIPFLKQAFEKLDMLLLTPAIREIWDSKQILTWDNGDLPVV